MRAGPADFRQERLAAAPALPAESPQGVFGAASGMLWGLPAESEAPPPGAGRGIGLVGRKAEKFDASA